MRGDEDKNGILIAELAEREAVVRYGKRCRMRIGRLLFGILIIMVLLIIFGDKGLMDYRMLKEKQGALEEANGCIINENDALKIEIGLLKSDVHYIESVARRELGMVKKGDVVYQFID